MSEIHENRELRMSNVLSFRRKSAPQNFQQEMERIGKFIEQNGLIKTGPSVSATFSVEMVLETQVLDMEILIPLDKPFTPPEACTCKPEFLLTNAVMVRHTGNPQTLQTSINEMQQYITSNGLQPITVGYSVMVAEPKSPAELDSAVIDVYVGVSGNRL